MGTDVGLRFKSCRGRGGLVENIYISNINMINIPNEAIIFNLFYNGKSRAEVTYDEEGNISGEMVPVSEETPIFRNIYIDNVTCKGAGRAIFFNGLPEMRIANINLDNIIITDAKEGAIFQEAQDVTINHLHIETSDGSPKVRMGGVKNVTVNGTNHALIGKLQTVNI
jgi:polygalacturonase